MQLNHDKMAKTTKASDEAQSTKLITSKVRFSYAHVFEPTAVQEGQEKKYSVSIIIDKKDKALVEKINKCVEAAIEQGKTAKFAGKLKGLKLPLRDGDQDRSDDENYAGKFFITASSKEKPGVVDKDLNPIMSKDDFYSGCFGRASLNFYPFNQNGNRGVAVGLNNLQKLEDGEPLSGRQSAEVDFSDEEDDDIL